MSDVSGKKKLKMRTEKAFLGFESWGSITELGQSGARPLKAVSHDGHIGA